MQKNPNTDIFALYVYNNSPYKTTRNLGLLGYCETNALSYSTQEKL